MNNEKIVGYQLIVPESLPDSLINATEQEKKNYVSMIFNDAFWGNKYENEIAVLVQYPNRVEYLNSVSDLLNELNGSYTKEERKEIIANSSRTIMTAEELDFVRTGENLPQEESERFTSYMKWMEAIKPDSKVLASYQKKTGVFSKFIAGHNVNVFGTGLPVKTATAAVDSEEVAPSLSNKVDREGSSRFRAFGKVPKRVMLGAAAIAVAGAVALGAHFLNKDDAKADTTLTLASTSDVATPEDVVALQTTVDADAALKMTQEEKNFIETKEKALNTYVSIIDEAYAQGKIPDQTIEVLNAKGETVSIQLKDLLKISGKEYSAARFSWVNHDVDYFAELNLDSHDTITSLRDSFRAKLVAGLTLMDENNIGTFKEFFHNFFETEEDRITMDNYLDKLIQVDSKTGEKKATSEQDMFNAIFAFASTNRENQNAKFMIDGFLLLSASQRGLIFEETLNENGYSAFALTDHPTEAELEQYRKLSVENGYTMTADVFGDKQCDIYIDSTMKDRFATKANEEKEFYKENKRLDDQFNYYLVSRNDKTASALDEFTAKRSMELRGIKSDSKATGSYAGGSYAVGGSRTVTRTEYLDEAAALQKDPAAVQRIKDEMAAKTQASKDALIAQDQATNPNHSDYTETAPSDTSEKSELVGKEEGVTQKNPDAPEYDGPTIWTDPTDGTTHTEDNNHKGTASEENQQNKNQWGDLGPQWNYETESPVDSNPTPAPEPTIQEPAAPAETAPAPEVSTPAPEPAPQPDVQVQPELSEGGGGFTVEEGDFVPYTTSAPVEEASTPVEETNPIMVSSGQEFYIPTSEEQQANLEAYVNAQVEQAANPEAPVNQETEQVEGPTL